MNRSCLISLRISLPLLEKIEETVNMGKFHSFSEAFRSYAELGMKVETLKPLVKEPKFLKTIDELKKQESIFPWAETLTDGEADAIMMAIKMEKNRRIEKGIFR